MSEELLRRIIREEIRAALRDARTAPDLDPPEEWLTTAEMAERLGLTAKELHNWARGQKGKELDVFVRRRRGAGLEWLACMVERLFLAQTH